MTKTKSTTKKTISVLKKGTEPAVTHGMQRRSPQTDCGWNFLKLYLKIQLHLCHTCTSKFSLASLRFRFSRPKESVTVFYWKANIMSGDVRTGEIVCGWFILCVRFLMPPVVVRWPSSVALRAAKFRVPWTTKVTLLRSMLGIRQKSWGLGKMLALWREYIVGSELLYQRTVQKQRQLLVYQRRF